MPDKYKPSIPRAQSSIKSLNYELSNLTPSSLIVFFEIDLSKLLETKGITLAEQAQTIGFEKNERDGILRFHNNIKIFNSYIKWHGYTYYPAPIVADGFASTTKGTLPTPTLTIASQSETGADQLALLKHEIRKFGDIIGAKVTRRRTFAKYLDVTNFGGRGSFVTSTSPMANEMKTTIPDGYEPDPYAELPQDVYYIERKETENKTVLKYQLSSILDLEGIKIPKRTIISDKCMWQYRGIGCWYQHATAKERKAGIPVPLLEKAGLKTLPGGNEGYKGLPNNAPPVANEKDEKMQGLLGGRSLVEGTAPEATNEGGKWDPATGYSKGTYVFREKDGIKYYFVCKNKITDGSSSGPLSGPDIRGGKTIPPNAAYWIADECSKTLKGCRLRWGAEGKVDPQGCGITKGELPFGGFPAARKLARGG